MTTTAVHRLTLPRILAQDAAPGPSPVDVDLHALLTDAGLGELSERLRTPAGRVLVISGDGDPTCHNNETVLRRAPRLVEEGLRHVDAVLRQTPFAPPLAVAAETLAQIALIARHGPAWFRAIGTPAAPGSVLCTVHTGTGLPQVVETAVGTPVRTLLGPDHARAAQAVLLGGVTGVWLPSPRALEARWEPRDEGARVIAALPRGRCGVAETARMLRLAAPRCRGGEVDRIVAALDDLAAPGAFDSVVRWSTQSAERGDDTATHAAARLLLSALAAFPDAFEAHAARRCTAEPCCGVERGAAEPMTGIEPV
ncbi:hypothetical protein [Streptacidiphilus melanogenes]|uniref:hypothetical protein n=1 Tax=Streptacidiphilus melanogenes TaxID=411235 RepID=UPI000A042FA4|nr:hypothetical protein [Streptacidiphilus melanogenes]